MKHGTCPSLPLIIHCPTHMHLSAQGSFHKCKLFSAERRQVCMTMPSLLSSAYAYCEFASAPRRAVADPTNEVLPMQKCARGRATLQVQG